MPNSWGYCEYLLSSWHIRCLTSVGSLLNFPSVGQSSAREFWSSSLSKLLRKQWNGTWRAHRRSSRTGFSFSHSLAVTLGGATCLLEPSISSKANWGFCIADYPHSWNLMKHYLYYFRRSWLCAFTTPIWEDDRRLKEVKLRDQS